MDVSEGANAYGHCTLHESSMQSDDLTRARMWLVITTLVLAIVLILLSGLSWQRTSNAHRAMVMAQGNLLLAEVRRSTRSQDRPTDDQLEVLVDTLSGEGLSWVGFLHRDGTVFAQGGAPTRDRFEPMPQPGTLIEDGAFMLLALPPPPVRRTGAAEPQGPPPGPPPGPIVLAFVPTLALGLQRGAAGTFLLSVIASVVFAGIAAYAWRESQRAEAQAVEAARRERLASLGEMSAVLAHEIRNPLAALKGHAQLLLETTPDLSRTHKRAQRIVRATARLQAIADGLLDFVRLGEVFPDLLDPVGLMRSAMEEAAPKATLRYDDAPDLWKLDATRMYQVFTNLLRNASESCPDGPIEVIITHQQSRLRIEVRDSGTGIPEEVLPTMFEPFRTTKTRGTGLGLAVSRRIVELHDGTLTATNRAEGGASFLISIP